MPVEPKLELIEWRDHYGVESDWLSIENTTINDIICKTAGYVIKEDKLMVCLAQTMAPAFDETPASTCGRMYILKKDIVKRAKLCQ